MGVLQTLQQKFNKIIAPYKAPAKVVAKPKPAPKPISKPAPKPAPKPAAPKPVIKLASSPIQRPSAAISKPTIPLKNTNLISAFTNHVVKPTINTKIPIKNLVSPINPAVNLLPNKTTTPKQLAKGTTNLLASIPISTLRAGGTIANSAQQSLAKQPIAPIKSSPLIDRYLAGSKTPLEKKLNPVSEKTPIEKGIISFGRDIANQETIKGKVDRYKSDLVSHNIDPRLAGPGASILALGALTSDIAGPLGGGGKKEAITQIAKSTGDIKYLRLFFKNAYKVATNQKAEGYVGDISKLKALVGLPDDTPTKVFLRSNVFNEILNKHPDLKNQEFNKTLQFVKTINIPDRVENLTQSQRINLIKAYEGFINKVGTKPIVKEGKSFVTTSYGSSEARNIKKISSEGVAIPSSRPVPLGAKGVGATLPTSKKSIDSIISQKGTDKTLFENFMKGKINDVMPKGQYVKKSIRVTKPEERLLGQSEKVSPKVRQQLQKGSQDLLKSVSSKTDISQVNPLVNTSKMNISPEAKQVISKTVEEVKPRIEAKIGQKLSNNEAINLANRSSRILTSAVGRETTLKQEAAVLRLRQDLAAAAEDGTVDKKFIDNLVNLKSYGTHIARQLQALGIGADPKTRNAKELIMDAVLAVNNNTEEILRAAKGVDFNDSKQSTAFYRKFIKPKAGEWIDLLRYNSMLSSPNTHIINTASNFEGTGIITPIEKTLAGTIDFLGSKISGKPRSFLAGEGAAYAKGYYSNLGNAVHKFADVMSGKQLNTNPDTRLIPLATKGVKGKVYKILDFPLRALEAADQFFITMTQAGEKAGLSYRASKGIKIPTETLDIKALELAKSRLFRGELGSKDQGYILHAFDVLAQHINNMRHNENPVISTISKYTIPFLNTPLNILKQGIEYSPTGIITLVGNKNKTEQLSKIALGSAAALGSASLLASGRTTWKEPTDPKKKAAFRAAGMQPYSVKVGDKWISYSKLHPAVAFNLALVSAVHDAEQNKTLNDNQVNVILNTTASLLNFWVDQSYVKSIGDLVSSAQGDVEGLSRVGSNYLTQLVPFRALSSWITRIVDPVQRQQDPNGSILKKQVQQIMMQFPVLSSQVPARLGPDGKPIKNTNILLNSFSPNKVTTENPTNKQVYNDLQTISLINKNSAISAQTSPPTSAQLKLRASQDAMGYTAVDKSLKSMSTNGRAQFFDKKLREAKTNEDVQKILKEYSDKKLINPDVIREMIKLPSPTGKKGASLIDKFIPKAYASEAKDSFVSGTPDKYKNILSSASKKYGVPTNILSAIAKHESGGTFNPSQDQIGGGQGKGMFQIDLGQHPDISEKQAKDPIFAANYASKMLRDAFKQYGNWDDAIKAYNAGNPYSNAPGYNGKPISQLANEYLTSIKSQMSTSLTSAFKPNVAEASGKTDWDRINKQLDSMQQQLKPKYDEAIKNAEIVSKFVAEHPDYYKTPEKIQNQISSAFSKPSPMLVRNPNQSDPIKSYSLYEYLFNNATPEQRIKINQLIQAKTNQKTDKKTFRTLRFARLYTFFPYLSTAFFSSTPTRTVAKPDFLSAFNKQTGTKFAF